MEVTKAAYYTAGAIFSRVAKHRSIGRSIYDDDWDVCIVLDSCRVDLLRQALRECPALDWRVSSAWSRGSITTEWLTQTFRSDEPEVENTVLISATPHTQTVFDERSWLTTSSPSRLSYAQSPAAPREKFADVVDVWTLFAEDHGAVAPETMRDATLEAVANADAERIVSHWLQPHEPWIAPDAPIRGTTNEYKSIWTALAAGDADPVEAWTAYRETLIWTLPFVRDVVESVDGSILITADHGNLFGEIPRLYGHPFAMPLRSVRKVPWILLDGSGQTVNRRPDILESCREPSDEAITAQLQALGYR